MSNGTLFSKHLVQ